MTTRRSGRLAEAFPDVRISSTADCPYRMRVSRDPDDPGWDAFLASNPSSNHLQTSLWGRVKAPLGWRATRLVATRDGETVAGAQLLTKRLPLLGSIGYVPRGPVLADGDSALAQMLMNQLHIVARSQRVLLLVVQPPGGGESLAGSLGGSGALPGRLEVAPTATLLIDLSADLDKILGRMRPETRRTVRRLSERSVQVRDGTEEDIDTFHRLLEGSSRRQRFTPAPREYLRHMWRTLHPHGLVKLFMVECEGEVVSAMLVVAFGDTVTLKRGGWSGRHARCRPNEAMIWAIISWAKAQGYRYLDFDGIEPEAAGALLEGQGLPESLKQTATSFKLGFGGRPVLLSTPHVFVYNPFLRWGYRSILSRLERWPGTTKVVDAIRGINRN
jgi:lipid II:glycine glycyltransferase (peptidoglycan interpeptide bridge formation enzyme)